MGAVFSPRIPSAPRSSSDDDSEEEVEEARLALLRRRFLGRAGTIATSVRGVLAAADERPPRRTLLGE